MARLGPRDAISFITIVMAGLLTPLIMTSSGKLTKEFGRLIRREIAEPLAKYTAKNNYYNQYQQLNLESSGFGSSMFESIPCDWGPHAGLPSLQVNSAPDFELYFIPPSLLQYFGYSTEYAALDAMGATRKMMCLPQDSNHTLCNCNIEIPYPFPGEFMKKYVYQGTIFKYYGGEIMLELWNDQNGVMYDGDGGYAKPACAKNKENRISNTKSWRINFANHYMASYACVDDDFQEDLPNRVAKSKSNFLAFTIMLGVLTILISVLFQHWPAFKGVQVSPIDGIKA